jgi:hypothetical protein
MTASLVPARTSIRTLCGLLTIVTTLAVAATTAIGSSTSPATPILVAGCDAPREATAVVPGSDRFAQTLAPRTAGRLTSAEVDVTKAPGSSSDWLVEIVLAERIPIGTPARAVVASATVPDATVPVGASTITARFAGPAMIGPSGSRNEYELVVSRPGASELGVGYRAGNDCPGQLFRSDSQTGPFSPFAGPANDLVFRLYASDSVAPQTSIVAGPRRRTMKRRAKFRWRASEPVMRFECKLDRGRFKRCEPPHKLRVRPGRHRFRVRAVDLAGNVEATPAKRRWRVRR